MKPLTLVLTVMVCLPALADEPKPWPQKGDTVYVSSPVTARLSADVPQGTTPGEMRLKACVPMRVTRRITPSGAYPGWAMESPERLFSAFRGNAWLSRFHKSETECKEVHQRLGDAKSIGTSGMNVLGVETGH